MSFLEVKKRHFRLVTGLLIFFSTLFVIACDPPGPSRQLAFVNNSDEVLNIVIEDEEYVYYDEFLDPQSTAYYYIDTGTYDFIVYDEEGYFVRESLSYRVVEDKDNGTSNYVWFDLEGRDSYVVANLNSFYEASGAYGGSIHSYKSKALIHKFIEDPSDPFTPDIYYQAEVVHPYDDMPKSVDVGDNVYAIIPLDGHVRDEEEIKEMILEAVEEM